MPPGHVTGRVQLNGEDRQSKSDDKDGDVPPVRAFGVMVHEAGVNVLILLLGAADATPDVLAVVEEGVGDDGTQGAETLAVHGGKEGGDADGRVGGIHVLVQSVVDKHTGKIVRLADLVVGLGVVDGEQLAIVAVGVVHQRSQEPDKEHETSDHVSLGPEGDGQRRRQPGGHRRPVESEGKVTDTLQTRAELVQQQRIAVDPADPRDTGQQGHDVTREPVVGERSGGHQEEEHVARHLPGGAFVTIVRDTENAVGGVATMEGVEQTGVDQVDGPDHGGRANEEAAKSTGETVTNKLGRDDEQETTAKAPGVVVVELLDNDDIDGSKRGGTGVGHDCDEDVLLDVERAGVEAELLAKEGEGTGRKDAGHQGAQGVGEQLSNHDTDGQWVVAEPEELVDKGQDHSEEDAEEPCAESASGERRIIGRRNCGSDFEDRLNKVK